MQSDWHVHSEWSWDAPLGSMTGACARAVQLGLPSIAFTEHVDHTVWPVEPDGDPHLLALATDGVLTPPAFDATGYLEAVERCRHAFPELRVLSGVELGEPHWHAEACARVLAAGRFDRVLGSLHCLPDRDGFSEPPGLFAHRDPAEVVCSYLAEVVRLVTSDHPFEVLAHIDYPVRAWPGGGFDPAAFEGEFREALRATARSGRVLEINTRLPLDPAILRWWRDEGGGAVSFGSDAHLPDLVAHGFTDAAAQAEACGFRPGPSPYDFWLR